MADLREQLRQADEDYLVGLSNKGIVKRAGKDLEKEMPAVAWTEEEARVTLKEETCVIRVPLGDSGCSCPSHSVCRHVVTAILWLKQRLEAEPDTKAPGEGNEPERKEPPEASAGAKTGQEESGGTPANGRAFDELLGVSTARLQRACGSQRFRRFLARVRAGEEAAVTETSIVTVVLPGEQTVVKLLEPLSHSTCSCHSRELCPHKAQALLAYQLKKGRVSLKELEALLEEEASFDLEEVRTAADAVCEAVEGQLATGLARQSKDVEESLERLAVLCRQAGLAQLENRLREAEGEYRQYFERSAAFRPGELAGRLLFVYDRAGRIRETQNQERLRSLAGSFRDRYEPAGTLRLMGMGVRSFASKSGYEGETWYFLETETRKWYTWTDARPVFYEGMKKRPDLKEGAPAPWSLGCRREQLLGLSFELEGAKAAGDGRLSASQETRGRVTGSRDLQAAAFTESVIWDYEEVLRKYFGPGTARKKPKRLALVGAVRWEAPKFDPVAQYFSWELCDGAGRRLSVSVKYTKEERLTIRLLERLEHRLRDRGCETFVCFGSLYLENGRLCLYPIEFYPLSTGPEAVREEGTAPAPAKEGEAKSAKTGCLADLPAVETASRYVDETFQMLTDLFTGGLFSAAGELEEALFLLGEEGERLGLHQAARELGQIGGLLQEKRRHVEFSPAPVIDAMGRLWRYLTACREKAAYDEAMRRMEPPGREQG